MPHTNSENPPRTPPITFNPTLPPPPLHMPSSTLYTTSDQASSSARQSTNTSQLTHDVSKTCRHVGFSCRVGAHANFVARRIAVTQIHIMGISKKNWRRAFNRTGPEVHDISSPLCSDRNGGQKTPTDSRRSLETDMEMCEIYC